MADAPKIDTRHAHSARVYNYWLGGKDNFAADRDAAEQAIAANPGIVADVRANREFLVRAVRFLACERGVRQFLDIGAGLAEPGVVQPQQWRPDPVVISPDQVTAWCGVARKG
jgi:hypothetical protein